MLNATDNQCHAELLKIDQDDTESSNTDTEYYKVQSDAWKQSNYVQQSKLCRDCVISGCKERSIKMICPKILKSTISYQGTNKAQSIICADNDLSQLCKKLTNVT